MAERVVAYESSKDRYTADAVVVWCFDDRFYKLLKVFGKARPFTHIDLVKLAGGAKSLAGDASRDREFIMDQIKASIKFHNPRAVILMTHRDCDAYGGSKSFQDPAAEQAIHFEQLATAKAFVEKEVSIPVEAYFADFDGLYKVA